jgi:hypothetical protein
LDIQLLPTATWLRWGQLKNPPRTCRWLQMDTVMQPLVRLVRLLRLHCCMLLLLYPVMLLLIKTFLLLPAFLLLLVYS